jgi:hypothetical protein
MTELICDTCGRIEHEPYCEGDSCFELCGGTFKKIEEKVDECPDNPPISSMKKSCFVILSSNFFIYLTLTFFIVNFDG